MKALAATTTLLVLTAAPAFSQSFACIAQASCVATTACSMDKEIAYDIDIEGQFVVVEDTLAATRFEMIRLPKRPEMVVEAFRSGIGPDQGMVNLSVFPGMNFALSVTMMIRGDDGSELIATTATLIGKCAEGAS